MSRETLEFNRFVSKSWYGTPALEALANATTAIRFMEGGEDSEEMRTLRREAGWAVAELGIRPKNDEDAARFDAAMEERRGALCSMPYDEYLKTDHWQLVRGLALRRARFRCCVCSRTASLQVHHNTYRFRGEEAPEDLIVLCAECHRIFHENGALAT